MAHAYKATCPTCGDLPGTHFFREDAAYKGEKHQIQHSNRITRFDPLSPEHACSTVRVEKAAE